MGIGGGGDWGGGGGGLRLRGVREWVLVAEHEGAEGMGVWGLRDEGIGLSVWGRGRSAENKGEALRAESIGVRRGIAKDKEKAKRQK